MTRGITPLGRQIAALPVHPRIGRLLIEGAPPRRARSKPRWRRRCSRSAIRSCAPSAARPAPRPRRSTAAATCSTAFTRWSSSSERGEPDSDVGTLNRGAAKHILRTRDQLAAACRAGRLADGRTSRPTRRGQHSCGRSWPPIPIAWPAAASRAAAAGVMVGGRGVRLADEVALADEELYVCVDVDAGGGEALVRQASAVDRALAAARSASRPKRSSSSTKRAARSSPEAASLRRRCVLEESQAALPGERRGCRGTGEPRPARDSIERFPPTTPKSPAFAPACSAWRSGCPT